MLLWGSRQSVPGATLEAQPLVTLCERPSLPVLSVALLGAGLPADSPL